MWVGFLLRVPVKHRQMPERGLRCNAWETRGGKKGFRGVLTPVKLASANVFTAGWSAKYKWNTYSTSLHTGTEGEREGRG